MIVFSLIVVYLILGTIYFFVDPLEYKKQLLLEIEKVENGENIISEHHQQLYTAIFMFEGRLLKPKTIILICLYFHTLVRWVPLLFRYCEMQYYLKRIDSVMKTIKEMSQETLKKREIKRNEKRSKYSH